MTAWQNAVQVVRKIAIFTVIGFMVITLSGPAIALLGAMLPFAFVGALLWLAYKAITAGPRVVFRTIGSIFRGIFQFVTYLPRQIGGRAWRGAGLVVGALAAVVLFFGSFLLYVGSGAVLGATLGVIGGIENKDLEYRVPAAALIGAGIGIVAALLRSKEPAKKVIVAQPMPQVEAIGQVTAA